MSAAVRRGRRIADLFEWCNPVVSSNRRKVMSFPGMRSLMSFVCAAFLLGNGPAAYAQANGDAKADQQKAEAAKTEAAHIADAARQLPGPAGYPECVRSGELTITNWMKFDMDTAARHMAVYDRFGCPGAHLRLSFRCLLRVGMPGPKDKDSLDERVRGCWVNPDAPPAAPAAAAAPAAPTTTAAPATPAPPNSAGTGAH
jgi:hypothetical protein